MYKPRIFRGSSAYITLDPGPSYAADSLSLS
jgi:hypothetical protein